MKNLLLTFALTIIATSAQASDKDILRDACSGLKAAPKRSECFNALDRISAPQIPTPAQAASAPQRTGEMKINTRPFTSCATLEFAEIDSMPREELKGLYCSYSVGSDTKKRINDEQVAKTTDPGLQARLIGDFITDLGRCTRGMSQARETFTRKYPQAQLDCTQMKEQVRANLEEYRQKQQAKAQ